MVELKKYALLLSIIVFLMAVKFIVIPTYDWQENELLLIKNKTKRLEKINKVLINKDRIREESEILLTQLQQVDKIIFPYQVDNVFRLEQQQFIEKLLEKHNLLVGNIGWQTVIELEEQKLKQHKMQLKFDGMLIDIINMFTELESYQPWIKIDKFNIPTRNLGRTAVGYVKGGNFTLSLYMYNTSVAKGGI